jgi:hypothetical protein
MSYASNGISFINYIPSNVVSLILTRAVVLDINGTLEPSEELLKFQNPGCASLIRLKSRRVRPSHQHVFKPLG